MSRIEEALKTIYNQDNRYRLLSDPDYFLQNLARLYSPEMKEDCKLLEKAFRSGVGSVLLHLTGSDKEQTKNEQEQVKSFLQNKAGLSQAESTRVMYLLFAMLGADRKKAESNSRWKLLKQRWPLYLHSVISVAYIIYWIILCIPLADSYTGPMVFLLMQFFIGFHQFLMLLSSIFSTIGATKMKPWGFLTAAILQTVATLSILLFGMISGDAITLLGFAVLSALGYYDYYLTEKLKK